MATGPDVPYQRKHRRLGGLLPWVSAAVLVAGVIAAIVAFTNEPAPKEPQRSNVAAQVATTEKTVPLPADVRRVAGRFILTAVARKNLDEAWRISAPALKEGISYEQWLTGAIPVVPYPTDQIDIAPMKIDYSYADKALLEVALLPKKGASVKPQIFFIGLQAFGQGRSRRWLVSYWAPRGSVALPAKPG